MYQLLRRLWKDEDGPTAVEYALMLAAIAGVIIVGAAFLGQQTSTKFTQIGASVSAAPGT
jgi:pilus assembly protein Flp/PilA